MMYSFVNNVNFQDFYSTASRETCFPTGYVPLQRDSVHLSALRHNVVSKGNTKSPTDEGQSIWH